jgi:hypothetical protein
MTNPAPADADPKVLLDRIAGAADGLFIMSESDSALTPFHWPRFFADKKADEDTTVSLRVSQKIPSDTNVETTTLEQFFNTQIEPDEGDDEEIVAEKRRLAELRDLLSNELHDVGVYRVGKINITAYILGQVPGTSDAAGVSAELVET